MSRATVGLLSSATAAATTATSPFSRGAIGFSVTNTAQSIAPLSSTSSSSSSSSSSSLTASFSPITIPAPIISVRIPRIRCGVAVKSDSKTSSDQSTSSSATEEDGDGGAKLGARVRVKVPLKVYHIPRVPEVDLSGKEGVLKQYVAVWKGKRISANLPYKVEFFTEVEGRGRVKFFAHLKEEEFEYV